MKQDKNLHANKSGKKGLLGYIIGGVAVSVMSLVLVAYWFTNNLVTKVNSQHQEQLIDVYTRQVQTYFDAVIRLKMEQTSDLAASNSLIAQLQSPEPVQQEVAKERLRNEIPGLLDVHLIRDGATETNLDQFPPINFATLDMVRRTERGQSVGMEELVQGNRGYIQLAHPVRVSGYQGTLVVFLTTGFLDIALQNFDPNSGSLALVQQFDNTPPRNLVEIGVPASDVSQTLRTSNPNWLLIYSPSNQLLNSTLLAQEEIIFPMAAVMIVVVVSLLVAATMLQKAIKSDAGDFVRYTQKLLTGQGKDLPNFRLALFLAMAKNLARVKVKVKAPSSRESSSPFESPADPRNTESVLQDKGAMTPNDEVLDISMSDADLDLLGMHTGAQTETVTQVSPQLFTDTGIQGDQTSLDASAAWQIGQALGSEAYERGEQTFIVARDGRALSKDIARGLVKGLLESGLDVIEVGEVPISVYYYAMHDLSINCGVMVTGDDLAATMSGFKITLNNLGMVQPELSGLYHRIQNQNFLSGEGKFSHKDVLKSYSDALFADIQLSKKLKVVVDGGHGVAGPLGQQTMAALGCQVVPLNCQVDGRFPSHLPDPSKPANLQELLKSVAASNAHVGIAFDGDGDRLGVVTGSGQIVSADRLLMLLARDVLSRNKGATIVYDIACSRRLQGLIVGFGGKPVMSATGRSALLKKMRETGALLAGSSDGNVYYSERWFGFDDAIYCAARVLEILASSPSSLDAAIAGFPDDIRLDVPQLYTQPELIKPMMAHLAKAVYSNATVTTTEGVRVDFKDGWSVVRPGPASGQLICRFEADNQGALIRILETIKQELRTLDSSLEFPEQ